MSLVGPRCRRLRAGRQARWILKRKNEEWWTRPLTPTLLPREDDASMAAGAPGVWMPAKLPASAPAAVTAGTASIYQGAQTSAAGSRRSSKKLRQFHRPTRMAGLQERCLPEVPGS